MLQAQNTPICMDGRLLATDGSGVATYTKALAWAQRAIDRDFLRLEDRAGAIRRAPSEGRAQRWLRALLPTGIKARLAVDASAQRIFLGGDIFRLAQVWFDVHRRLLPVSVPGPPGLMHWSHPMPLRLVGWRNVYTVHDVIPLTHPSLSPIAAFRHRRLLRCLVGEAMRSGAIATVSEAARDAIIATLGCRPDLVTDCGQAVLPRSREAALPAGLENDGYLLVCGSIEPRKNIAAIVAAYHASGVGMPLVLAGPDGWQADTLRPLIEATPGVKRLAHVDTPTMTALMAGARGLLMPSLAEGFGLPVVEAMALGTPVLTSREGALAQTAAAAALLVDPYDAQDLAAGIRRIVDDRNLREALTAAGVEQARRFTPDRFANRLSTFYDSVIARTTMPSYRQRSRAEESV